MNEKFESHHYSIKDLKYVPKAVHAWFHKMICDTFPSTFLFSGIAKKSEKRKDSWYAETNDDNWDGAPWRRFGSREKLFWWKQRKISGAAAAVLGASVALGSVEFDAGGVAAGDRVAAVQGAVYGGATGGVFAALQAAGAGGVGLAANALIGGVGGYLSCYFDKENEDDKKWG